MEAWRTDEANRFGLEPRPPSPPPAWLRGPWWVRWSAVYLSVAALFIAWTLAVIDGSDQAEVVGIAAPHFAIPMLVLVVLVLRTEDRAGAIETPRAFAWGAGFSLLSTVLFMMGYAGWPFMIVSSPAALAFLMYAIADPAIGYLRRSVAVRLAGPSGREDRSRRS